MERPGDQKGWFAYQMFQKLDQFGIAVLLFVLLFLLVLTSILLVFLLMLQFLALQLQFEIEVDLGPKLMSRSQKSVFEAQHEKRAASAPPDL